MKRLLVKAENPIGLVDMTGIDPFHFSITKKDIEEDKVFEVPDNSFFRGKIEKERLLSMVGEKDDAPQIVEESQEKRRYKRNEK